MRIFYFSVINTLILCFVLWGVFQVGIAYLGSKIPRKYISPDSFWFRLHKWEDKGKIYSRLFKVNKWKTMIPDAGRYMKSGFEKKNLKGLSIEELDIFLVESCRAELTHLLAILPFWIFGLFTPPIVILIMFIYAVVFNFPFIIVQRYNRPRIKKIKRYLAKKNN